MKIKIALVSLFSAMFVLTTSGPLFAEQAAKGVVTKVSGGVITVKDRHGRLSTVHVRPGDIIVIKVK
ncbi:MAG TPA: hypothetical protein VK448_06515 [Dissulfurispiraceae bacterium]|nr:hypothetical protein [Dissulfurispiraceae bacterium]